MKTIRLVAIAAALPVLAARARAQDPAPATSVPASIVRALFGTPDARSGDSTLRIYLGAAPAKVAQLVPAKPVTVVASSASPRGALVVLAYPAGSDDAAEAYIAHLQRAGWTRPVYPAPRGGFVSSKEPGRMMGLCRDSLRAFVLPVGGAPAGQRYVRAQFYTDPNYQPCQSATPGATGFVYELEFPMLEPPQGARMLGSSGGGASQDSREIQTRLATTMSPADLVSHYAAQLEKAGWTVGERLAGDAMVVQAVSARDTNGRPWRGMLSAMPTGETREVRLVVSKVDER